MQFTKFDRQRFTKRFLILIVVMFTPVIGVRAQDSEVTQTAAQAGARALATAFRNAAKKATPSVVTIFVYGQNQNPTPSENANPNQPSESENTPQRDEDQPGPIPPSLSDESGKRIPLSGLGSGVIISAEGLVITNHHVVAGAKRVIVQLGDEAEIEATDVHSDPASDIATLRIKRDEPFIPVEMGDSDTLDIGDWVLAIGSPFRLEATVSAGIISAKNRTIPRIRRGRLLQTDAAINPGNSGGPLIDLDGRLIAINTAIATRNGSYQGIGFAIPINQVKWTSRELDQHGHVRRAALGVRIAELTPRIAAKVNLPAGLGILVSQVIKGSAADRAGLKPMDVIREFAGDQVLNPNSLQEIVERQEIGSTCEIKVYRGGDEIVLEVELAPLDEAIGAKEEPATKPDEPGE
jgi:serine protease Do